MDLYPKISIVTPSFNDARFLETTILSVIDQGYPNLEYIIIDGGSTDGSVEIIKKYENNLAYWICERDNGMYHAILKGFAQSTGDIMGWINSDDRLHKGSLFTAAQIFNDFSEVNWIQGHPNTIDESDRVVSVFSWPELNKLYFYKETRDEMRYIQQESTLWRRSLWEKAGSHVSTIYKYAGDFELWMRFFQFDKLYNINALIGSFRVSRGGQASIDHFKDYVKETYEILAKYPLSPNEIKKLKSIERFEYAEQIVEKFFRKVMNKFKLSEGTAVNDKIYFENSGQKFRLKKRKK